MKKIDSILCITATKFSKGAFVNEEVTIYNDLINHPWNKIADVDPPKYVEGHGYEEVDFIAKKEFWAFRFDHSCTGTLSSAHPCCNTIAVGWESFADSLPEIEAKAERAAIALDPSPGRIWDGDVSVRMTCTVQVDTATSPEGEEYRTLSIKDFFDLPDTLIASDLDKELSHIQGMCGAPDAAEACRQIIKHCDTLKTKRGFGQKKEEMVH